MRATDAHRPSINTGRPTVTASTDALTGTLVVSADREMRAYLLRCLQSFEGRLGRTFEAADGQTALEQAGRAQVELVITDLVLPRLDGLALARRLAGQGTPPMVLVMSGEITGYRGRSDVVAGWLAKPFDRQTVYRQISALLARRERGSKPGEGHEEGQGHAESPGHEE